MRYFARIEEPPVLKKHWLRIGNKYAEKRAADPSHSFRWPTINKIKLNEFALPLLRQQTQEHCSYCDRYFDFSADHSIDHFKPKSDERFYSYVCKWDNLYLCCNHCQRAKGSQYDEDLLRPDEKDYWFHRYFVYNSRTNQIDINPDTSEDDKRTAEKTSQILNFNNADYNRARKKAVEEFEATADLDRYQFRFLFE
jgi:uncharacterized protein (TIGR02646 family)